MPTSSPHLLRAQDAHDWHDDVVVVVPAYNEEAVIASTVRGLLSDFRHVVVVDDGSADRTSAHARAAGATVVRHPVNLGQGAALQTGFTYARTRTDAAHVVTFDADGQHRVEDAVRLVEVARASDVDVVLGSRFLGETVDVPLARRLVLGAAVRFSRWTTGLELTDAHNGLRVLSRSALGSIEITLNGMAHASQLLNLIAERKLSYVEEPVTIEYTEYSRAHGQSNLNALNILFDLAVERLRACPSGARSATGRGHPALERGGGRPVVDRPPRGVDAGVEGLGGR